MLRSREAAIANVTEQRRDSAIVPKRERRAGLAATAKRKRAKPLPRGGNAGHN
jgi:hypothetical protein